MILAAVLFAAIDLAIVWYLRDGTYDKDRSGNKDLALERETAVVGETAAERLRLARELSDVKEQVRAVVRRLERQSLEREQLRTKLDDHLGGHLQEGASVIEQKASGSRPRDGRCMEAINVEQVPVEISIMVQGVFESGSADVQENGVDVLDYAAQMMVAFPDRQVDIIGHTDATGREEYNLRLSQRRAAAVRDFLIETYGLPMERFTVVGRGEAHSMGDSSTAEGARANRRVEVVIRRQDCTGEGED